MYNLSVQVKKVVYKHTKVTCDCIQHFSKTFMLQITTKKPEIKKVVLFYPRIQIVITDDYIASSLFSIKGCVAIVISTKRSTWRNLVLFYHTRIQDLVQLLLLLSRCQFPIFQMENSIANSQCCTSVRDNNHRLITHGIDISQHLSFRRFVQRTRRFIQQ